MSNYLNEKEIQTRDNISNLSLTSRIFFTNLRLFRFLQFYHPDGYHPQDQHSQ